MLYVGHLIILDGQNIKKNQLRKFQFLSCRGWKNAETGYAPAPL